MPGLVLALAGGAYVLLLPRLLRPRDERPALVAAEGKQFIAELDIVSGLEPDRRRLAGRALSRAFPMSPYV